MQARILTLASLLFISTAVVSAVPIVYVDQGSDFTPASPVDGELVTWNSASGPVSGLTFGTDAFDTIQDAVDAVDSDGVVNIAAGTYNEGAQIEIDDSLTLQGDGAVSTILSGNESHRHISVNGEGIDLTINDLSLIDGVATLISNEGFSAGSIFNNG